MARYSKKSNTRARKNDVMDVYRDMLAEATSSPMQSDQDGRSIKKRRVAGRLIAQDASSETDQQVHSKAESQDGSSDGRFQDVSPVRLRRVVQTESEDSADSDVNWEEVDLKDAVEQVSGSDNQEPQDLNIVLGNDDARSSRQERAKRKPITAAQRKLRLEIHKMHLCTLLVHVYIRNHWCNDESVHSILRRLLSKKLVSHLNPDENTSQFQRSRSFLDGLQQASELFRRRFRVTARGMAKGRWVLPDMPDSSHIPDDIDLPIEKEDFLIAAKELSGSRDIGAQLFSAMLRAAGIDARLVCSLQPLPFRAVEKTHTPQRKYAHIIPADPEIGEMPSDSDIGNDEMRDSETIGSRGGQNRFTPDLGEGLLNSLPSYAKGAPKRPIRESRYPVYWVEAFNEAAQKWVPVDPLVTKTISKPGKFEPPAGERENSLNYVIAFEDDDSARDVTRRYAKAYNAKTRRDRVEATKNGAQWWKKALKVFKRPQRLDRDQLEDAELASKEAAEPMPRNVQDFKEHPYYALERHLRRHEVIHPKREVGKMGSGRGHNASALESIYRRRDVHVVQSGDKWYRTGREIKPGEQPLKWVPARKKREVSMNDDEQDDFDEDQAGTALYSLEQTTIYKAPPVVDGRIPKNVYGNLDIYVDSMIPPGGAHIQHKETVRIARLLGIDYAEAVTGFQFKGRHGTAITNGAVVPADSVESVLEVIRILEDERAILEQEKRTAEVLGVWKKLLIGLRIRERIEGYDIEGERDEEIKQHKLQPAKEEDEGDDSDDGGGFLPDGAGPTAEPTAVDAESDNEDDEANDPVQEANCHAFLHQRPDIEIIVVYGEPINTEPSASSPPNLEPKVQDEGLFDDDPSNNIGGGGSSIDDDAEEALQAALTQDLASRSVSKDQSGTYNELHETAGDNAREEVGGGFLVEDNRAEASENNAALETHVQDIDVDPVSEGSEDEKGSLLSHDPEDEELDPDF